MLQEKFEHIRHFGETGIIWLPGMCNIHIMAQHGLEMHVTTKGRAYLTLLSNTFDILVK